MLPLERFRAVKAREVAALRRAAEAGTLPGPLAAPRSPLAAALDSRAARPGPLALIAEYKRASPSRGVICHDLDVEEAARQYARAGAAALSILTETAWFHGDLAFLDRAATALAGEDRAPLPLLRKDFIFDELQVAATAATPASALLLIVRLTPDARTLRRLRESAEAHGMEAVVEVFDGHDLALARESGSRIIQVNARDLESLAVDRRAALRLIDRHPPQAGERWIAASGMREPGHLAEAAQAGFVAALVGTALMAGGRPGAALAALLGREARPEQRGGRPC